MVLGIFGLMLYEIRVQLQEIEPPIWRVLRVGPQTNLIELHKILQTAMGWSNCHLHLFEIDGIMYGDGDFDWDFDVEDYRGMKLDTIFRNARKSLVYVYDLGDDWQHDISLLTSVEGSPGESVSCIAGGRACPTTWLVGISFPGNYYP